MPETLFQKLAQTSDSRSVLLIRLLVGLVFLSEGIQKFLFPELRGAGRFAKIGLPYPELLGSLVGGMEVLCGTLVLLGLLTRMAAIPLVVIMLVAIVATKLPLLAEKGFWEMLHSSRTDWAMLLGSIFLLVNGAGKLSADRHLQKNTNRK